jgi:hypothetical protein
MKNSAPRQRWTIFVIFVVNIFFSDSAFAAFIISGESSYYGSNTYSYIFTDIALSPDYKVQVNETALSPDITLQIVTDPRQADLVFVDEFGSGNLKVCKPGTAQTAKTIKLSTLTLALSPDITVQLSKAALRPDYKIYILSKIFTKEEVAALFAVLLKKRK